MSLERLKDVNLASVLGKELPTILILRDGYIASKLGDSLIKDHNLFFGTIIRDHEELGLQLYESLLAYEEIRKAFSETYSRLYNAHLSSLYKRLNNIFDNDKKLCRLAIAVCNMLLLLTSDKKTLEKVLEESLYYWARVGAKFGYIANQSYNEFVNNYNTFMALAQAIEDETGISFDLSQFTDKAYRKLFVDTLVDVYNSYILISDEFELFISINNVSLYKEIAKAEIQKKTSTSRREILNRSLQILYEIYELIRRNVSDIDEYDVKIKMLEDVAGDYDFCKVISDTFKAIKVHIIDTLDGDNLNKLYKAWLQAMQLLIHELHKQR